MHTTDKQKDDRLTQRNIVRRSSIFILLIWALAVTNGSPQPGLWLTSPTGWLPRTRISSGTPRSLIEHGLPLPLFFHIGVYERLPSCWRVKHSDRSIDRLESGTQNNWLGRRDGGTRRRFRLWRRHRLPCVFRTEQTERWFQTVDVDVPGQLVSRRQLAASTVTLLKSTNMLLLSPRETGKTCTRCVNQRYCQNVAESRTEWRSVAGLETIT